MAATRRKSRRAQLALPAVGPGESRRAPNVIDFPVFEHYGDQIADWLSAIGDSEPSPATVTRVAASMRRAFFALSRVRNSDRHASLATFVAHATEALNASQWEGVRYLLMMALAFMTARPVPVGASFYAAPVRMFRQFPKLDHAQPVEAVNVDAATGIVTG